MHILADPPLLDELRSKAPASLIELAGLPGLPRGWPLKLYRDHGVISLDQLDAFLRDSSARVPQLSEALRAKIIEGIALKKHSASAILISEANAVLEDAATRVRDLIPDAGHIYAAGDFRRGCELVAALSLVVERPKRARPGIYPSAIHSVELNLATEANVGSTLLFATGPAKHVQKIAEIAAVKGLTLDKSGLKRRRKRIAGSSEAEIYEALGLPFIPPELREERYGMMPPRGTLVVASDVKGLLHAHTIASDGVATLEEMAAGALDRGYRYLGITEHSQSASYAGGLSLEGIKAQSDEIDAWNRAYDGDFRILKGIEVDILPDGTLDYDDDILARFDFVIASIHSRFQLDEAAQTARLVKAVSNPLVSILGHMTGRQLLRRPGYEIDIEAVLRACAANSVAVEINCNPIRLDLDWRWHQCGMDLGCLFSINPDAHSVEEFDYIRWGIRAY